MHNPPINGMEIRRLTETDSYLLSSAVQLLIPEDERAGGVASESHLGRALQNRDNYFLVCLENEIPIGFLSAFRIPAVGHDGFLVYLYDIVVEEQHRRRGIGSGLIEELKRQCRRDQVDQIWVGTALENDPARRIFEMTGAEKIRETYVEYVYRLGGGRGKMVRT